MSWSDTYTTRIARIRDDAGTLLSNSRLLAGFHYHTPSFGYYEVLAAARDLRSAADDLDKLAGKLKGDEKIALQEVLQAAE